MVVKVCLNFATYVSTFTDFYCTMHHQSNTFNLMQMIKDLLMDVTIIGHRLAKTNHVISHEPTRLAQDIVEGQRQFVVATFQSIVVQPLLY